MMLLSYMVFMTSFAKIGADGQGGGVAVYVTENIAYKRLYTFEVAGVEAIWLSIQTIEG